MIFVSLSLFFFFKGRAGEGFLLHLKITGQLLEALSLISYCQIICPFFLCLTQLFFSHLFHLSPVPVIHGSSSLLVYVFTSMLVYVCVILFLFLILLVLPLLLFTRCPILPFSYYSFSAFLLSPLLSCHLWVTKDSCLKGRIMPVFTPHIPFE